MGSVAVEVAITITMGVGDLLEERGDIEGMTLVHSLMLIMQQILNRQIVDNHLKIFLVRSMPVTYGIHLIY